jgi:hypothetical protein
MEETYHYLLEKLRPLVGYPLHLVRGKPAPALAPSKPYYAEDKTLHFPVHSGRGRKAYWEIVLPVNAAGDKLCRTLVGRFAEKWKKIAPGFKQSSDIKQYLVRDEELNWDTLILSVSLRGSQRYNALELLHSLRRALLFRYEDRPIRLAVLMSWNLHSTLRTLRSSGCVILGIRKKNWRLHEALFGNKALNSIADGTNSLLAVTSKGHVSAWIGLRGEAGPGVTEWEMVPRQFQRLHEILIGRDFVTVAMPTGELFLIYKSRVWRWSHLGWRRISGPSIRLMLSKYLPEEAATTVIALAVELGFSRKGALIAITSEPQTLLSTGSEGMRAVFKEEPFKIQDANLWSLIRFASIDGCVVLDSSGTFLNAGVILNVPHEHTKAGEGARTAAASYASTFGIAIKVSQDGPISVFEGGQLVRLA